MLNQKTASCAMSLAFAASLSMAVAQSKAPPAGPTIPGAVSISANQRGTQVQLGVTVSKPTGVVYAQLPKLPRGSGFLLQTVIAKGTADVAGLQTMDIIWKLDGQILINENQMMILLSHRAPGDRVKMSYFHSGEAKETTLILQGAVVPPPLLDALAGTRISPRTLPMVGSLPMRVISYEDRSASISDSNGMAILTFREGKPWLHVESSHGEETFNGPVSAASDIASIPVVWRSRFPILQRSLEESIQLRRLPRVRRVPTPKQRIAGGQ